MTRRLAALALPAVGALMLAFIGVMAFTGRPPGTEVGHFEAHGIVATLPSAITRIELAQGRERWVFRRVGPAAWAFDQPAAAKLPDGLASHLETGLRFLSVSAPARTFEAAEYDAAALSGFQLDPPVSVVSLATADGTVVAVDFGALNPSGTTQYVRLVGQPTLYLLPRYVGGEWQLTADMAKRLAPPPAMAAAGARSTGLLLPMSIDEVAAVEIVYGGTLSRFERDGSGHWFLHQGQHVHAGGAAHVADPVKAPVIAAALAAFEQTQIEALVAHGDGDLGRYGLARPAILALVYGRDISAPLARIEIGNAAGDGFARYARLAERGDVVKIAAFEAERLIALLKAVGSAS